MRSVTLLFVTMAVVCGAENSEEKKHDPEVLARTKSFLQAFMDMDHEKMRPYFVEKISFDGDVRFLGRDSREKKPILVAKDEVVDAYRKLFSSFGEERRKEWKEILKKAKPSLEKVVEDKQLSDGDGKPLYKLQPGDYIYDIGFREAIKGKRKGLDEAIIFVFRKGRSGYVIVAHYSDL